MNEDECLKILFYLRYLGEKCKCGSSCNLFKKVSGRKSYQCPCCAYQIFPKAGTIFEKSTTPLTYWFFSCLLIIHGHTFNPTELKRCLSVTYKTALRIHKLVKKLYEYDNDFYLDLVDEVICRLVNYNFDRDLSTNYLLELFNL